MQMCHLFIGFVAIMRTNMFCNTQYSDVTARIYKYASKCAYKNTLVWQNTSSMKIFFIYNYSAVKKRALSILCDKNI